MIKILLVVVVLLGLAVFGLAIQIIFRKNHKFPETHIGKNPNMKNIGVGCATSFDKMEQSSARKKIDYKPLDLKG